MLTAMFRVHEIHFACTIENCAQQFPSRAAWEAHESSEHSPPLELWKCMEGACRHISYLASTHREHLAQKHGVTDDGVAGIKTVGAHVGGGTFWCGFCRAVVGPVKLRVGHVAEHFEKGKKIEDWVFV